MNVYRYGVIFVDSRITIISRVVNIFIETNLQLLLHFVQFPHHFFLLPSLDVTEDRHGCGLKFS